jgi:hopanoid biosynthesis associated RND transporter like protein HpnN
VKPNRLLAALVAVSARRRIAVIAGFVILAALSCGLSATRLRMTTDVRLLFSPHLAWTQRDAADRAAFPQFQDTIVAVIDAALPEAADATASELAARLSQDHAHFLAVSRPDASPYLQREGLLFLSAKALSGLLDRTVDAEPFLGEMAADPSGRGLFRALGLIGVGVARGQADLANFEAPLRAFHATLAASLAGQDKPLSWESLMSGEAAKLAGPNRIVLIKPRLDFGAVQPGGAATAIVRQTAARLEFVRSGVAHVNLTGPVPLEDEEFSSAASGALSGLVISFGLIVLWLYLALGSWRLILPVSATLLLGLALTTGFAAAAVGTLNLISVAFAILFVGIAVDFAIQFAVRFRDLGRAEPSIEAALARTGGRVGIQVLVASAATASGFLAFVPTDFRGVAELGLIAGGGMLIAFVCTLTFLPAMLALCRPALDKAEIGFAGAAPADRVLARVRVPLLAGFALVFVAGAFLTTRLNFDSNTLHTKRQDSEAVRTLLRLLDNPITNPFTIDVLRPSIEAAQSLAAPMARLSLVDHVVTLGSLVPADQDAKLAALQDAAGLLAPVLSAQAAPAPSTAELRAAIAACLTQLGPALGKLPPDHPLAAIAGDMRALQSAPDTALLRANAALVRFLPVQLARLRVALGATKVGVADIPADLRRDYVLPDGRARIVVVPKTSVGDSRILDRFVAQAVAVAPDASGPAVTIVATARTIIGAFKAAAIGAVVAIGVILLLALRRLSDAARVLAPLLLSASMTVVIMKLAGMELNYANIIALPLLLGVGVSFNIYFVMNFRAGQSPRLTSATTRAVVFSALTTSTAFGSLAVSAHPGTASMGTLLLISLACTLVATLVFLPALLGNAADDGVADPPGTGPIAERG